MAAWDGSVEGVSDALRVGVHADTTMPVRDFGTLDIPLVFICTSHRDSILATIITLIHQVTSCGVLMLDINSRMLRPFMYKTKNGEEHSSQ